MKVAKAYLADILLYLDRIERYTADGRDAFLSDEKTQDAVIRDYEVIGEIAKRLPNALRDANPGVEWRRLIGFRDFLAHNYEEVILAFVWTAVLDVPRLRAVIREIVNSMPGENVDPS
jgi:uncharacterized protein with HEPN domain